jgi:hypothetical protein
MLRGGEWQLSVVNNLVAAGFVVLTIITWNWRFLLGAMFFGWGVQWLIRVLGRHDPKWWRKYRRYSQQPAIALVSYHRFTGSDKVVLAGDLG